MRTEIVDGYGRRHTIEWPEMEPRESLDHVLSGYGTNGRGENSDQEEWRKRRVAAAREYLAALVARAETAEARVAVLEAVFATVRATLVDRGHIKHLSRCFDKSYSQCYADAVSILDAALADTEAGR